MGTATTVTAVASNDFELTGQVSIEDIVRDKRLQPRDSVSREVANKYAKQMANGMEFPPVLVHQVNGVLYLVDGWHRMLAAEINGRTEVPAAIVESSMSEAIRTAALANMANAQPLKNKEYRNVFRMLISSGAHHKGRKKGQWMTYEEIGQMIGKSKKTVYNWMVKDFPRIAEKMGREKDVREFDPTMTPNYTSEQSLLLGNAHSLITQLSATVKVLEPAYRKEVMVRLGKVLARLDPGTLAKVVFKEEEDF